MKKGDLRSSYDVVVMPNQGGSGKRLVYDIEIDDGTVAITFTLTSPGCPIGPQVSAQMREFVGELDEVERVEPRMVFTPPWTPDRMSEDAKFALGV